MAYDNTNKGTLSRNDRKTTDKHPDFKGKINIDGKDYWLSGWTKSGNNGDFISLAAQPKESNGPGNPDSFLPDPNASRARPSSRDQAARETSNGFEDMDDDIPF